MKLLQISKHKKTQKALIILLELFALLLVIYLLTLPFYPELLFRVKYSNKDNIESAKDIEKVKEKTEENLNKLPKNEYDVSPDRLIITKIGVNAPIVESNNEQYGLSRGAWLLPDGSTPDKGGNTIITGHRFKYLPPSNLTFYLFHKLEEGDIISAKWKDEKYYYKVRETKIVEDTDFSILEPSEEPILTMFTCDPIYSTENRLVIVADLIIKD